ncbi:MAG: hypothetical protein H6956_13350 [Chromatiaceae bacterium]|nr:hypothetical protein [Chromatiaceae bacterium]
MSRKSRDRRAAGRHKKKLHDLTLQLLAGGPGNPDAVTLGEAICSAQKKAGTKTGVENDSKNGYRVGNRHAEV